MIGAESNRNHLNTYTNSEGPAQAAYSCRQIRRLRRFTQHP